MVGLAIYTGTSTPLSNLVGAIGLGIGALIYISIGVRRAMLRRRSPQEQEAALVELFSQGKDKIEINAAHYSISQTRAKEIAERHGYVIDKVGAELGGKGSLYTYRRETSASEH